MRRQTTNSLPKQIDPTLLPKVQRTVDTKAPVGIGLFDPNEFREYIEQESRRKLQVEQFQHRMGQLVPTPRLRSPQEKIGRNQLCSCGSGMKFKKCCHPKTQK